MRGDTAEIGEYPQRVLAAAEPVLAGFHRIVRHGHRLDGQAANRQRVLAVEQAFVTAIATTGAVGTVRKLNRNLEFT